MANTIPLSTWWDRQPTAAIAITPTNTIVTFDAFQLRVSAWVETLTRLEGDRFAVFHHDAAEFLAILCALWQLSRTACIPSNALPGTIQTLSDKVDGFVGQFNIESAIKCPNHDEANHKKFNWNTISSDLIAIEVFTSGTTGEPRPIQRTIQAIECELLALDKLASENKPSRVITTVSHHHLYGMTFRLLKPFVSNIAFNTYICEYLEDVIETARCKQPFCLVSSPAHLSRFNQHLDWQEIKDHCVEVISSAAPLNREDSLHVRQLLEAPVKEIYGSSETGAMAWRTQHPDNDEALWQPLSHLLLASTKDGSLSVTFKDTGETLTLADQVNFKQNNQFSLQGRMDQIAKVEGKRISLTELEQVLTKLPYINESKATTLSANRDEIAVAIVLSDDGISQLRLDGYQQLVKQLKKFLSLHFEAVLIPKRWRLVTDFPYNSQGKLTKQAMSSLFTKDSLLWPQLISVQQDNQEVTIQCYISPSTLYFNGHFDQQAILPGVVQLHWAIHYGNHYFKHFGKFKHIENLKFKQIILPKNIVDITLRLNQETQKLFFSYSTADNVYSSGRICYE